MSRNLKLTAVVVLMLSSRGWGQARQADISGTVTQLVQQQNQNVTDARVQGGFEIGGPGVPAGRYNWTQLGGKTGADGAYSGTTTPAIPRTDVNGMVKWRTFAKQVPANANLPAEWCWFGTGLTGGYQQIAGGMQANPRECAKKQADVPFGIYTEVQIYALKGSNDGMVAVPAMGNIPIMSPITVAGPPTPPGFWRVTKRAGAQLNAYVVSDPTSTFVPTGPDSGQLSFGNVVDQADPAMPIVGLVRYADGTQATGNDFDQADSSIQETVFGMNIEIAPIMVTGVASGQLAFSDGNVTIRDSLTDELALEADIVGIFVDFPQPPPDDPDALVGPRFEGRLTNITLGPDYAASRLLTDWQSALASGDGLDISFDGQIVEASYAFTQSASVSGFVGISTVPGADCDSDGIPDEDAQAGPLSGFGLDFDGVDDFVTVPGFGAIAPTTEVTVEFWQKVDAAAAHVTLAVGGNLQNALAVNSPWSDGQVYWRFGNSSAGGQLIYTPPEPIVGSWQHFAFVASQSGNTMRIYRNGVLEATKVGMDPREPAPAPLRIGAYFPPGNYFGGLIDELRVWNVARSQAAIQLTMNATLNGDESGLLAYWRFDEGMGASAGDSAGNSDGTLVNGPVWTALYTDCNSNGLPDGCEPDTDGDGVIDDCDTSALVTIAAANPPLDNPYVAGQQPFLDVLDTGTGSTLTAGIGGAATPPQGPVVYSPISVSFSGTPSPAPALGNVVISCTGPGVAGCPSVMAVTGNGPGPYSISLSGPIPPGRCTTLTFAGTAAGQKLQYRSQPGNVSMDAVTNTQDMLTLVQALNNGQANQPSNLARYNVNRSTGVNPVNTQDLLRLVQLLNGTNTTQAFNGAAAFACP